MEVGGCGKGQQGRGGGGGITEGKKFNSVVCGSDSM